MDLTLMSSLLCLFLVNRISTSCIEGSPRDILTNLTILRKTQPRTAKNYLTRAHTHQLKFLPHEHAPPHAVSPLHAPHAPGTSLSRTSTCLPRIASCHISPKVTSHCHINRRHHPKSLTVDFDQSQKFSTRLVLLYFFI